MADLPNDPPQSPAPSGKAPKPSRTKSNLETAQYSQKTPQPPQLTVGAPQQAFLFPTEVQTTVEQTINSWIDTIAIKVNGAYVSPSILLHAITKSCAARTGPAAERTEFTRDYMSRILAQATQIGIYVDAIRDLKREDLIKLVEAKQSELDVCNKKLEETTQLLQEAQESDDQQRELVATSAPPSAAVPSDNTSGQLIKQQQAEIERLKEELLLARKYQASGEPGVVRSNASPARPIVLPPGPEGVIQSIRNSLGVDVDVPLEARRIIDNYTQTMERALEKISKDIYSTGSQFLLELIQNADDNHYGDGVVPSLKIYIDKTSVWTVNNELGFSEENVRALCNVGGSTKQGEAGKGRTGNKGIGFKSVFKVSDFPAVFSNNYSFRFNVKSRLGYIVPEWLSSPALPPQAQLLPGQTHIYLPLNDAVIRNRERAFDPREFFDKIDHAIIFLRRLRALEIHLDDEHKVLQLDENLETNTISLHIRHYRGEVRIAEHTYRYRVVRQTFDVPADLADEAPNGEKTTEIVIAFPTHKSSVADPDASAETEEEEEASCAVYTFLPVRAVGFRFLLNANFKLVASRQDVHKQLPWNKWLRDRVPAVFVEGVQNAAIAAALKADLPTFLPGPSDVADAFWASASHAIRKIMAKLPCVPTESGNWRCPADTIIRPADLQSQLISNDDLLAATSKEFVASTMSREVALRMMASELQPTHLVASLREMASGALKVKPRIWFKSLYEFLSRNLGDLKLGTNKAALDDLARLPIFPASTVDNKAPLLRDSRSCPIYQFDSSLLGNGQFAFGSKCMESIHPEVLSDDAQPFLRLIGIKTAFIPDIVRAIIDFHLALTPGVVCPVGADSTAPPEGLRHIWEQVRFIYVHIDLMTRHMADLQQALCLPCVTTNRNYILSRWFETYTDEAREVMGAVVVPYITMPPYIASSKKDKENFERLATALGCNTMPRLIRIIGEFDTKLSHEARLLWLSALPPAGNGQDAELNTAMRVLQYIQKHFNYYSTSEELRSLVGKFGHNFKLVPTQADPTGPRFAFSSCFANIPVIRTIGGDALPYMPAGLFDLGLLNLLGVHSILNKDSLLIIEQLFRKSVKEAGPWKALYAAFKERNIEFLTFEGLFIPASASIPALLPDASKKELSKSSYRKTTQIRASGHPDVAAWAGVYLLEPHYGAGLTTYLTTGMEQIRKIPPTLRIGDCKQALGNIMFDGEELRPRGQLIQLEPVLLRIYEQIDSILAKGSLLDNILVLSHNNNLRSMKMQHNRDGLLIPDELKLVERFEGSRVSFVHPKLMNYPHLMKFLAGKLPTATKVLKRAPKWFPREESVSRDLTLRHRACFNQMLAMAMGSLSEEDRQHYEALTRDFVVVLVDGKAANQDGLFVTYQLPLVNSQIVSTWSQKFLDEYFINREHSILYVSAKSKFATTICFEALLDITRWNASLEDLKRALPSSILQGLLSQLTPEQRTVQGQVAVTYELDTTAPVRNAVASPNPNKTPNRDQDGLPPLPRVPGSPSTFPIAPSSPGPSIYPLLASYLPASASAFPTTPGAAQNSAWPAQSSHPTPSSSTSTSEAPPTPSSPKTSLNMGGAAAAAPRPLATPASLFNDISKHLTKYRQMSPDEIVVFAQTKYKPSNSAAQPSIGGGKTAGESETTEEADLPSLTDDSERKRLDDMLIELSAEYLAEIGQVAETFVFETLKRELAAQDPPIDFGPAHWVSQFRSSIFPDCTAPIENDAGYDLVYNNGKRDVYVEVKGTVLQDPSFHLSKNEWQVAQSCNNPAGPEYVIYLVSICPEPRILHILRDPPALKNVGALHMEPLSFKVTVRTNKLGSQAKGPQTTQLNKLPSTPSKPMAPSAPPQSPSPQPAQFATPKASPAKKQGGPVKTQTQTPSGSPKKQDGGSPKPKKPKFKPTQQSPAKNSGALPSQGNLLAKVQAPQYQQVRKE